MRRSDRIGVSRTFRHALLAAGLSCCCQLALAQPRPKRTVSPTGRLTIAQTPSGLPPPAVPAIPAGDDIILYLHGGPGSRLEEAGDLVAPLMAAGQAVGRRFTVISFDQPSQGYSAPRDQQVAASPHAQIGDLYPLVQLSEEFIVAFVNQLDAIVPIKNRNIIIIGGSTGGLLALRMGHRAEPWIQKIVAWNPASVWTTYTHDVLKGIALQKGFDRAEGSDAGDQNRKNFFDQVFGPPSGIPLNIVQELQPNPEEWYRGDRDQYKKASATTQQPFRAEWACKWDYLASARLELQEIYSEPGRRWHWRLGTEELLFSFFNDSWTGPANTASDDTSAVYQSIVKPTLLMASDDDDWNEGYVPKNKIAELEAIIPGSGWIAAAATLLFGDSLYLNWENRWTQTNVMGRRMQNTPGYLMLVHNTGHSIHNERPQLLAQAIAWFVSTSTPPPRPLQILSLSPDSDEPCSSDFTQASPKFKAPNPDYPAGRFPTPVSALLDWGGATRDPAVYLKELALLHGNFSDGSSPGTYGLRLRLALREVAKAQDPAAALMVSAISHYRGDDVTANAMADLAVTGRNAYARFFIQPPSDDALIAAVTARLPPEQVPGPQIAKYKACVADGKQACLRRPPLRNVDNAAREQQCEAGVQSDCRRQFPDAIKTVPPDPQRIAASVQLAKSRALQVAWALRNPDTAKALHDRSALGWIAVSAEDDPPARPVNVPSGIPIFAADGKTQVASHPQFDLPVTVSMSYPGAPAGCSAQHPCSVTFDIRYTIASPPTGRLTVAFGARAFAPVAPAALSVSACATVDGAACLPASQPPPPPGRARRAIVTVSSKGQPVGGVDVSVSGQGNSRQTGANGIVVVDYLGCVATARRASGAATEVPTPCLATAKKNGFVPDAFRLP